MPAGTYEKRRKWREKREETRTRSVRGTPEESTTRTSSRKRKWMPLKREKTRTRSARGMPEESATRTASRMKKRAPLWRKETWARSARRTPEEPVTSGSYTAPKSRTQKPVTSKGGTWLAQIRA
ncbi:hypothetical protein NDU88_003237 [Pleurodeles waltl]|uniref:Uncharacterized protein n=1 Tax=Pleurodeles waltl TaxID=8319 RepID=A0AAV7NK36_PLEWA|nr:hypothetical protein NDU88_003237 [Pleurodeles waltl]